jgi:uncharacterized protein YggE
MTPDVIRRTGLAALAAAALFGAAQVAALPARVSAQSAPESTPSVAGTLSATGIGQVAGDPSTAAGALMMSVEERSTGTDVQAAVQRVQDRIAKLRAALTAAGIPGDAITLQGFNVGPSYGYPYPMPVDAPPGAGMGASEPAIAPGRPVMPPEPTGYMVNAQLMADTTSPEQLATAMRIAIESGATNVNSFVKGGPGSPTPPDSQKFGPAITQATEQARVMAQASAQAAGVTLGGIHSVTVLPASPIYSGGPGPVPSVTWQVQVRVTYHLQ